MPRRSSKSEIPDEYIDCIRRIIKTTNNEISLSEARALAFTEFVMMRTELLSVFASDHPLFNETLTYALANPTLSDTVKFIDEVITFNNHGNRYNLRFNNPKYTAMIGAYLSILLDMNYTEIQMQILDQIIKYLQNVPLLKGDYRKLFSIILIMCNYQGILNSIITK